MKNIFILFLFFTFTLFGKLQSQSLPDPVMALYEHAASNSEKGEILRGYFSPSISQGNSDELKTQILRSLNDFTQKKDEIGIVNMQLVISIYLNSTLDFANSIKVGFDVLPRFEKIRDTLGLCKTYSIIGIAYESSKNYKQAIYYKTKAKNIAFLFKDRSMSWKLSYASALNNLAYSYLLANTLDSALQYGQDAFDFYFRSKDTAVLASFFNTIGETYTALKQYDIATTYLKRSILYSDAVNGNKYSYSTNYCALARISYEEERYDSSLIYSFKALHSSRTDNDRVISYEWIYKNYDKQGKADSSNRYYRLSSSLKDSIYSIEKQRAIQDFDFKEQLRQREMEAEKMKLEDERHESIQFAILGIGIISLLILFLLLSRTIIVKPKLVRAFGIIGLLITFEFLNLLLHPFLERVTDHSPVLMLLSLAAIASLLLPFHHWLEHWITTKMMEKNEKIRLAVAKRIIEEAEKKKAEHE